MRGGGREGPRLTSFEEPEEGSVRPGSRGAAGADPEARERRGTRHRPRWRREASLFLADLGLVASPLATVTDGRRAREKGR